jgi:hypothetical protein
MHFGKKGKKTITKNERKEERKKYMQNIGYKDIYPVVS